MLGLGDWSIAAACWSCIVITVICVIFGTVTWNGSGKRKGAKK